jgi:hypothetical protein
MIDQKKNKKKSDRQGQIYTREMARARYEKKSAEKKLKPRREVEDPVEAKIQKAMADGEFDNLKGKGKPLDLSKYEQVAEHMRIAYHILRNADFVPEEVRLKKEMEELKEKIKQCRSESEKKALRKQLADISQQFHFTMEYNKQFKK